MLLSPIRRLSGFRALCACFWIGGILAAGPGLAQTHQEGATPLEFQGVGPWIVEIPITDRSILAELGEWSDLWGVLPEKGVSILQVDREGLERLQRAGFGLRLDRERTERLRRQGVPIRGQEGGIPGFPC